jgi:ZIP family zinc transporter
MVTSAGLFLVPQAVGFDPRVGGLGVAAGILTGFGAHVGGHRLAHVGYGFDDTAVQLSAHALSAGVPTAVLAVPGTDATNALVFGFAAGIFLHIAMDFLPRCEVGGEVG